MRIFQYAVLLLFFIQAHAKPVDLLSCFADAIANDPTYQAQVATYKATFQSLPEAASYVLPQATLSAALAREYEMMGQLGKGTFHTNSYGIQATQTIFNYTQFKQISQARYSVRSAFATLLAQEQELIVRTTKAYFDVLQAHDLLLFAEQQHHYLASQLSATKSLFEHNDATITDLEQAQGAYDLINADLDAAKIRLYDAIQTLSQITGIIYKDFTFLNSNFPLAIPNPNKLDTWVDLANHQNWNLRASRLNILAAQEALKATKGNFLPSLNGTAGFTRANVPSLLLIDTVPNNSNIVGLNANWNFLQGGLTVAQVKAAVANLQQAEATMRQQYLQTMADTRKAFNNIVVGVPRVKNVRASLVANTKAINHAEEAYKAGELTITEILQIQYQLYRAQVSYADYVYSYILNFVLIKQAAGTLDVDSLVQLNNWLDHKKLNKTNVNGNYGLNS